MAKKIIYRDCPIGGKTTFSEKESQFITDNYLAIPVKTMATILGRSGTGINSRMKQLGLVIPEEIIKQRKKESRFNKGHIPKNKGKKQSDYMTSEAIEKTKPTRFKKGQSPHNTNYNGHERITKDGYIEIRIKKGKYRLKHLHEWEKLNGKLPKGYCLRSKDDNKLNTAPDNWELITRAQNMILNSGHNLPTELKKTIRLKNKLVKTIKEKING